MDDLEPLQKGHVGIAAWGSAAVFHSVKITGQLDPTWVDRRKAAVAQPPK